MHSCAWAVVIASAIVDGISMPAMANVRDGTAIPVEALHLVLELTMYDERTFKKLSVA